MDLGRLYRHRFDDTGRLRKAAIWKILCDDFFSQFVAPTDAVLEVGAGYCEFINNIRGRRKIAVDVNPRLREFAQSDVEVHNDNAVNLLCINENSVDVVFMSNFLEHLRDKQAVHSALIAAKRCLKRGGKLIILQPNIRLVGGAYWDFFDHHTPLTETSLIEALSVIDMKLIYVIPRFLPYTTKGRLPQSPSLVRFYLRVPLLWRFFGKQSLIIAEKTLR